MALGCIHQIVMHQDGGLTVQCKNLQEEIFQYDFNNKNNKREKNFIDALIDRIHPSTPHTIFAFLSQEQSNAYSNIRASKLPKKSCWLNYADVCF